MDFRNICTVGPAMEAGAGRVALIVSASFEKRCLHVAENLSSKYWADAFLVCRFVGDYELQRLQDARFEKLRGDVRLASGKADMIECAVPTYEPSKGIHQLEQNIGHLAELGISHIDFDVSTFTKQYIILILNLLDNYLPNASLRILYSPADRYGPASTTQKQLSSRVRQVIPIPGFDTFVDMADVKDVLVAFMGFEEHRVATLVAALKPAHCIPVFQRRRNTHLGAKAVYESNRRLIDLLHARYAPSSEIVDGENPNSTRELLLRLYDQWVKERGYVLLIAPHGSKMEAVGAYLFCREAADPGHVGIVYAMPVRYNERDYSGSPIGYIVEYWVRSAQLAGSAKLPVSATAL